ncbi:MAG: type II site-specific deoxyribonuclease [Proteobacteria bacterium]|jgi:hypothetical protein|nr:type II site-specific deoxyribonuclease [Pseudomonadota bacterium]
MDQLKATLKAAAARYNKLLPHHDQARDLVFLAHAKLAKEASYAHYGDFSGRPSVAYHVFGSGTSVSRPVRSSIYLADPALFSKNYATLCSKLKSGPKDWGDAEITLANSVVYTAVMAVACCFDLWQRGSRKTPGTVFEILMASLLQQMLPKASFSKHIPLAALVDADDASPGDRESEEMSEAAADGDDRGSVSTDLVIRATPASALGVVIPLKITTRERIVQPFAHQRILDSAFGAGVFQSLLVCISETQLDENTRSVKQVCVPGTVKLFQKYLAPVAGLYYCDIPQRYDAADMQRVIPVKSVGHLFCDVLGLLDIQSASSS